MNKYHQEILKHIKKKSGAGSKHAKSYCGTTKKYYDLRAADSKKIAKEFKKKYPDLTKKEFIQLLDSLAKGESHEEMSILGRLLGTMISLRKQITPKHLNKWLENAEGWAEVDSICQSNFTSKELLGNWEEWEIVLNKFVKSKNIHKRRASLVLLIKSLRESEDKRLTNVAFKNIEKLKKEDHKLITKAISWILREMIKKHRAKVEKYLNENEKSLPSIAVRETKKKLKTGRK